MSYAFVSQYLRDMFPDLIDLDRFNVRRRQLVYVIEAIRRGLRDRKIDPSDPIRLLDSAPLMLMTYTRGARCKSVVGDQYFGVVTSKKGKVFGLRLHVTTTDEQLIDAWLLAPASIPDPQVVDALVYNCRGLALIGAKLYSDAKLEDRWWRKRRILLLPLRSFANPVCLIACRRTLGRGESPMARLSLRPEPRAEGSPKSCRGGFELLRGKRPNKFGIPLSPQVGRRSVSPTGC